MQKYQRPLFALSGRSSDSVRFVPEADVAKKVVCINKAYVSGNLSHSHDEKRTSDCRHLISHLKPE